MKKIFFLFVALTISLVIKAQSIQLTLLNGQSLHGTLESVSDTMLTIVNNRNVRHNIPISQVTWVNLSGKNKLTIAEGKFVLETKEKPTTLYESHRIVGDPNYAVGKALKSVGKTSIALGITSLIAGTILVAYGYSGTKLIPPMPQQSDFRTDKDYLKALERYCNDIQPIVKTNKTKADCATAGCVILPFGASLTVIGIPLTIKGKQLMELKVNYTGNGAGLALAW